LQIYTVHVLSKHACFSTTTVDFSTSLILVQASQIPKYVQAIGVCPKCVHYKQLQCFICWPVSSPLMRLRLLYPLRPP